MNPNDNNAGNPGDGPDRAPLPPPPPILAQAPVAPSTHRSVPISQRVHKLNRATAVAVSLAIVGLAGLGTGIAIGSASANEQVPANDLGIQQPRDSLRDDGNDFGLSDPRSGLQDQTPDAESGAQPYWGFDDSPQSGGTHGGSGQS